MQYKYFLHGCSLSFFILFILLLLSSIPVIAHHDLAYNHDSGDFSSRAEWMKSLSNSKALLALSLPGTHDSGARYGGDIIATQSHTIMEQLNAGIRFLDIRARHIQNRFAVYHGIANQHMTFDEVLLSLQEFLKNHPSETVLVRVKQEEKAINSSQTFAQTLQNYIDEYPQLFLLNANIYTKLGNARGKAIILRDFSIHYDDQEFGIRYGRGNFVIQDDYVLANNWGLYYKWQEVKAQIELANNNNSRKGFINYLSASTGAFPYFVAGGRMTHQTHSPRLFTGYFTLKWSDKYPDFPKLNCVGSVCAIFFDGINDLTRQYLEINKEQIHYVGIIAADFPGSGLIDAVIAINF